MWTLGPPAHTPTLTSAVACWLIQVISSLQPTCALLEISLKRWIRFGCLQRTGTPYYFDNSRTLVFHGSEVIAIICLEKTCHYRAVSPVQCNLSGILSFDIWSNFNRTNLICVIKYAAVRDLIIDLLKYTNTKKSRRFVDSHAKLENITGVTAFKLCCDLENIKLVIISHGHQSINTS